MHGALLGIHAGLGEDVLGATRLRKDPQVVGPGCWSPKGPAFRAFQAAGGRRSSQGCASPAARPGAAAWPPPRSPEEVASRSAAPGRSSTGVPTWRVGREIRDRREGGVLEPLDRELVEQLAHQPLARQSTEHASASFSIGSGRGPEGERRADSVGVSSRVRAPGTRRQLAPRRVHPCTATANSSAPNLRPICARSRCPARTRAPRLLSHRLAGELDHRGGLRRTSVRYDLHSARRSKDGAASSTWWPSFSQSAAGVLHGRHAVRVPRRCQERSGGERDPQAPGSRPTSSRIRRSAPAGDVGRAHVRSLRGVQEKPRCRGRCESARVHHDAVPALANVRAHRLRPRVGLSRTRRSRSRNPDRPAAVAAVRQWAPCAPPPRSPSLPLDPPGVNFVSRVARRTVQPGFGDGQDPQLRVLVFPTMISPGALSRRTISLSAPALALGRSSSVRRTGVNCLTPEI